MRGWILVAGMLCATSAFGFQRQAPNGATFTVNDATGELSAPLMFVNWGTLCVRVCNDCAAACANGNRFQFPNADSGAELNGLQFRTGVQNMDGLNVRRKIYVPSAGGFDANGYVRYLDLLSNGTAAPITVQVRVGSSIGGGILGAGAQVWRTHNDDAAIEITDRWAVVDDNNPEGGLGAVGVVVHGAGARAQPTRFGMGQPNGALPTSLGWDFDNVRVDPGQTVAFLTIVVHEDSRLDAITETSNLVRVRDVDVLFGLTDAERRAVVNFDIEPGAGTPVADAGGPYNVNEGSQVQLAASGYDPELGGLSYEWDLDDDGVFDDADGSNAVAIFPDDGTHIVRVRVTDDAGEIDIDAGRVTVRNVRPVIEGVNTNQPLDEGSTLTVAVPTTDPGADVLTYDFDWDGDGEYEEIDLVDQPFEHRYFADGQYNARVRVRDDEAEDVRAFEVNVNNVAPQVLQVIAPSPSLEGANIGVRIIANDPGNDPITYRYDIDGDGEYDREGVGLDAIDISFPDDGIVTMRVQVVDDQGASSQRDHEISILNARPTINVITNSGPVFEGAEVVLDVDATDPGTDELTYSFDFNNDGSFVDDIIDQEDSFAGTIFRQQGEHTVGVRVRDDDGGIAIDTTVVVVNNAPPTAEIFAPDFPTEGEVFEVRVEATDPGDDVLRYDWDLTGNGEFDQVGVAESVQNTSFPDQGDFEIRCRVSDGDGGEVTVTKTVRVRNEPPQLEIAYDSPQAEGAEVAVEALVNDPGNDDLRFFFDFDDDGDFEIEDSPSDIGRHRYPDEGLYTMRVLVDDGSNLIDVTGQITIENAAPSIDLVVSSPVPEGENVAYTITAIDPGINDAVFVDLFFDTPCNDAEQPEGEADLPGAEPDENGDLLIRRRALDGLDRSRVCACARDEDDGRRCMDAELVVQNVDPLIPEFVPIPGQEGRPYNVGIPATDPANPPGEEALDPLTFSLENPPGGIAIDPDFGIIEWVPTYQNYLSSPIELTACVEDGDGGRDCATFEVEVDCIDVDLDSMCDTWERNTCDDAGCLDPEDPLDAELDPDMDGRNNAQEFADGTNPFVYEGPLQPESVAPDEGCSDTLAPTFEVTRVEDELERPVELQFVLYSDPALEVVAADSGWIGQPAEGGASWTPDEGLLFEDQAYWWRARARTGFEPDFVITPWTEVRGLQMNATNAIPTAPVARAPADGSQVDSVRPELSVVPSEDPDGACDTLIYRFRIYRADAAFTTGEGDVSGESIIFTPTENLIENGTFQWDVVAVDGSAETSEPSERWTFTVDTQNQAPDTPTLIAPVDRSTVESLTPEFRAGGSVDLDQGDVVHYRFTVRLKLGDTLGEVVAESGDIPENEDGEGVWVPEMPLEEDARYVVELRATDTMAESDMVSAEFFVSSVNAPPAKPSHITPEDGVTVPKKSLLLSWTRVPDPEGADVTYDVELCRDEACTPFNELGSIGVNVENSVFEGATYTWRVKAVDADLQTAGFTDAWTFTVEDPTAADSAGDDCGCSSTDETPGGGAVAFLVLLALGLRRRR